MAFLDKTKFKMTLRGGAIYSTGETPRGGAQPEMLQPLVDSR